MADGHGQGTNNWEGPYDPLLMQDDLLDDVMYLIDNVPNILDPPPLAAQPQNATAAGYSGDNPATLNAYINVEDTSVPTPTHIADVAAHPTSTSSTQDAGACTSAATTASTSAAAAAHQNALDCTGCHVLREVLHSNGLDEATKLYIHGDAGAFYHAILEVYRVNSEGVVTAMTHQSYIDFRGRDFVWVKDYLTEYAQQRTGAGYTVIHDSITEFHDALCTSMIMKSGGNAGDDSRRGREMAVAVVENGGGDQHQQELVENGGGGQQQELAGAAPPIMEQGGAQAAAAGPSEPSSAHNEQERGEVRPVGSRSALAIQRERASNLQLSDLARYFHLTMTEAARQLGVCPTVLKNTSRKFNIPRWPHRKIKSIDSRIAKLRKSGDNGGAVATREIERLVESRRKIYFKLLGHH